MKNFDRRLNKLKTQLGIKCKGPRIRLIMGDGIPRALDQGTCLKLLEEAGFLSAAGPQVVSLHSIPQGLNAEETARFLRENGELICGPRRSTIQAPENAEQRSR